MIKRGVVLCLASVVAGLSISPVLAQSNAGGGSIKVDKNHLDHVSWPKGRPELQIIDESPIVVDKRERPQAPDTVDINIAPLQTAPGKHYVVGEPSTGGAAGANQAIKLTPSQNNLPSAGFQSNVDRLKHPQGLPSGSSTPVVGGEAPIGWAHAHDAKNVDGKFQPKSPATVKPMTYGPNYGAGTSSQTSRVETDAKGKVVLPANPHPLLKHLNESK